MKKFMGIVLSCTFLSSCALPAKQETSESAFVPPEGSRIEKNVQVTMRDGKRMNSLVILPAAADNQTVPTILIRTPYKTEIRPDSALHQRLLSEGYGIVMQHERGRYFSEGNFEMLGGAVDDGWDTIDWIISQPWSDGQVGTYGCSSSGENQLKLSHAHHPAHKAMVAGSVGVGVAEAGPFREQGNFWRGGVWQQGWMNYFLMAMQQDWPQLPSHLSNEQRQNAISSFDLSNAGYQIPASALNEPRMHLPMIEIMEVLNAPKNEVVKYLTMSPVDESWSKNRISQGERIKIPGLWFESLYDISARSSLAYFEWNRSANAGDGINNQVLRLTQGGHCSFGRQSVESEHAKIGDLDLGDMRYDYVEQVIGWFNQWIKLDSTSTTADAYTAYLGYGKWLSVDSLPMQGNETWFLSKDNELSSREAEVSEAMTYRYDPNHPVPSLGGEIYGEGDDHFDGSFDQRILHERDDVVVFTSQPLSESMTLFGMAEIRLSVSSDQPDTDFTVKINEVFPDGRAFNLGDSIIRMRYRKGLEHQVFMREGEVYQVDLPPVALSRLIKKGHRLQVEVSSSNFPSYARNLNTANNPYTSTQVAIANNTLHVGKSFASFIRLPVYEKNKG